MIDFQNGTIFKLAATDPAPYSEEIAQILIEGEQIHLCFKGIRDFVVFTDKRLISVNVQGITGKKRDFTSLPYSKVQAWSVETAGVLDLDAELELWFSGLGKVRLEFKGNVNMHHISQLLGHSVL